MIESSDRQWPCREASRWGLDLLLLVSLLIAGWAVFAWPWSYLPLCLPLLFGAVSAWTTSATVQHVAIDHEGTLILNEGAVSLAPREIEGVWWPFAAGHSHQLPRKDSFSLRLTTVEKSLVIPPLVEDGSRQVLGQVLASWSQPRAARLPMELDQWARGQAEIFGTEAVWTFEPRSLSGGPPNRPALFRFWAGFALGLLSLAVWGSILLLVDDKEKGVPLIVLSVMGSMFCTLPLALNWVSGSRKLGGTPSTFGLVIAPQGLAMVTETHRGILAWPDVVRLRDRPPTLQLSREDQRRVLQLDVRGASILIQDRWNAPLIVIRRLIESNLMARDPSAPASN